MSIYSLDSLENIDQCSNDYDINEDRNKLNLVRKETTISPDRHNPFYLEQSSVENATKRSNESTAHEDRTNDTSDRTRSPSPRNAIIASRGSVNASRSLVESPAKRNEEKGDENREKNESRGRERRRRTPVNITSLRGRSVGEHHTQKRSEFLSKRRGESLNGRETDSGTVVVKANKKLANVLVPIFRPFKRPDSYLELHSRKFGPPHVRRVQSPEGSTLSIYGDTQREEITEEDGGVSFTQSPRDDRSELSFYRHLIEQSTTPVAPPRTSRSDESLRRSSATGLSSSLHFSAMCSLDNSVSDESAINKKRKYKPYTIQDYKNLPVPKPDRSLGPDKIEIQAKREWLMRRRSYGDSASERNRQQIVQRTLKIKVSTPTVCNTPTAAEVDTISVVKENPQDGPAEQKKEETCKSRKNSKIHENDVKVEKPRRSTSCKPTLSRNGRNLAKTKSRRSSSSVCDIFEDSHLESLRKRHLREKELVDRMIREALPT